MSSTLEKTIEHRDHRGAGDVDRGSGGNPANRAHQQTYTRALQRMWCFLTKRRYVDLVMTLNLYHTARAYDLRPSIHG